MSLTRELCLFKRGVGFAQSPAASAPGEAKPRGTGREVAGVGGKGSHLSRADWEVRLALEQDPGKLLKLTYCKEAQGIRGGEVVLYFSAEAAPVPGGASVKLSPQASAPWW